VNPFSGKLLLRNSLTNFVGLTAPLFAAVACLPGLIAVLGNERFAILSIAYVFTGYFTLLDLGVGRALTQRLAQGWALAPEDYTTPAQLIWTGTTVMFAVGTAAGVLFYAVAPAIIAHILRVNRDVVTDCTSALRILALSLPFVVSSAGWRGVFEAYQRFTFISIVRTVMGVGTLAGALFAVKVVPSLSTAVAVLVAMRIAGWAAHAIVCLGLFPQVRSGYVFVPSHVMPLVTAGGWIAANGIFGSISLWLDRFLIARLISTSAVTYYSTPFDVVSKISLVTGAVSNVLFSAFAAEYARSRSRTTILYRHCVAITCLLLLPVCIALVLFARVGLSLWISPAFAGHSYRVAQAITVGTYFLSAQAIPWSLLQSTGRAIVPAVFDIVELVLYLPAVWMLTAHYGLVGAALAWAARSVVGSIALFVAAEGLLEGDRTSYFGSILALPAVTGLFALASFVPMTSLIALALASSVWIICWVWLTVSLRSLMNPPVMAIPGPDLKLAECRE